MSAYNKVNGEYCTENKHLLKEILRKEWKYNGIVISDWGAENNRVEGIKATNDLEMPGGRGNGKEEILKAVKANIISEKELDKIVERIIQTAQKTYDKTQEYSYNQKKHHEIALKIAEESVVLLKNENNILPIQKTKIAVIGDMAKEPRYQGAGSSTINPYNVENALESLRKNNIE